MKEGFTFKWASLKFLRKVIFKSFGGEGNRKEPRKVPLIMSKTFFHNGKLTSIRILF